MQQLKCSCFGCSRACDATAPTGCGPTNTANSSCQLHLASYCITEGTRTDTRQASVEHACTGTAKHSMTYRETQTSEALEAQLHVLLRDLFLYRIRLPQLLHRTAAVGCSVTSQPHSAGTDKSREDHSQRHVRHRVQRSAFVSASTHQSRLNYEDYLCEHSLFTASPPQLYVTGSSWALVSSISIFSALEGSPDKTSTCFCCFCVFQAFILFNASHSLSTKLTIPPPWGLC